MCKKQQILVVDDERFNLTVLSDLLKSEYTVILAKSGEQAIERAKNQQPDLILLDIVMPEMDGYEVCRRLKDNPETKSIPIIFITSMQETADESKGFEVGAVDYITKPINPVIVKARVKTHLKIQRLIRDLQKAIHEIKTLNGLLPICSNCKKIRDDKGYWNQIETYIGERSEAEFSHSICPECADKLYPELRIYEPDPE